jgi:GR25 family glycosyltransferase involved in LPS biosynthesis
MKKYFLLLFLILLVVISSFFKKEEEERYTGTNSIDYYVITLGGNKDRMDNIQEQKQKINCEIEIVDAVNGNELNLNYYTDAGVLKPKCSSCFSKKNIKREVGCYMSHLKVYDKIKYKNKPDGYSVIFEDDFRVKDDKNFIETVNKSIDDLKNTDFDYLFLGMLNGDGGKNVISNVYELPKDREHMYCAHAYIIKNKNIYKIIENLKLLEHIIDVAIFNKGKSDDLIVYKLTPEIVSQNNFITTSIRTE